VISSEKFTVKNINIWSYQLPQVTMDLEKELGASAK
jgi:hypothetical protein